MGKRLRVDLRRGAGPRQTQLGEEEGGRERRGAAGPRTHEPLFQKKTTGSDPAETSCLSVCLPRPAAQPEQAPRSPRHCSAPLGSARLRPPPARGRGATRSPPATDLPRPHLPAAGRTGMGTRVGAAHGGGSARRSAAAPGRSRPAPTGGSSRLQPPSLRRAAANAPGSAPPRERRGPPGRLRLESRAEAAPAPLCCSSGVRMHRPALPCLVLQIQAALVFQSGWAMHPARRVLVFRASLPAWLSGPRCVCRSASRWTSF